MTNSGNVGTNHIVIKRTVEISSRPAHLSSRHQQLVIQPHDEDRSAETTIPCEDIGLLLVDHPQVTITHRAMSDLAEAGAAVVVCGRNHLPAGIMLPLSTHHAVNQRFRLQVGATAPANKRIWQQLVRAKIRGQAGNLVTDDADVQAAAKRLQRLADTTASGDPANHEAQAATAYWKVFLRGLPAAEASEPQVPPGRFRRDQDGGDPVNAALNYGYTVMRAAVGRAIVAAGFTPVFGVMHSHRANAFALADDLIEPLRPLVDARVQQLYARGDLADGLKQNNKARLLDLLTHPVVTHGRTGPLMVALHSLTASLAEAYETTGAELAIPVWKRVRACR